jgi:glucose-1-phosphate thymidylyltransferase
MKALVLSADSGSRLRPITYTLAKQLLPVANKPVLFYGLEDIRDAGLVSVGIVVGETAPAIRAAVGDGSAFGLDVTYITQHAPLGLAHAVLTGRKYLADDDFVMYLGDNFIIGGITWPVEEFSASHPAAQIMLTRVSDPRRFGVAEVNAVGQVMRLGEKPRHSRSDLALVGVYIFSPEVHEAVAQLSPSARGELEITEAIQWLIDHGRKVNPMVISGYWQDTGNVEDMLDVNRLVLDGIESRQDGCVDTATQLIGRVVIEEGATVTASRIVGPAIVGSGSHIHRSYVGPFTSVGHDCYVIESEIEHSIMLGGSSVRVLGSRVFSMSQYSIVLMMCASSVAPSWISTSYRVSVSGSLSSRSSRPALGWRRSTSLTMSSPRPSMPASSAIRPCSHFSS